MFFKHCQNKTVTALDIQSLTINIVCNYHYWEYMLHNKLMVRSKISNTTGWFFVYVWVFVCTCDLVGTNLGGGLISLQIWLFALLRQEF